MEAFKRTVQALLHTLGYRLVRIEPGAPFPYLDVLDVLLGPEVRAGKAPFFVQIGANDGRTDDPLHHLVDKYALGGLMVEPQPNVFAELLQNRGSNPRLRFENALIGDGDGSATLFVPKLSDLVPRHLSQAASLDRAQLEAVLKQHFRRTKQRKALARVGELITPIQVPSISMETLLRKHGVTTVDLLVLDTMGFDFKILQQYPFPAAAPQIIHFEHKLLAREERRRCFEFLRARGYRLCMVEMDTIAVKDGPLRQGSYAF